MDSERRLTPDEVEAALAEAGVEIATDDEYLDDEPVTLIVFPAVGRGELDREA